MVDRHREAVVAFAVSSAKVNITPTAAETPFMAGFGAQQGIRTVVSAVPYSQPLYARCVILWDSGFPNAVISVDVLAIPRSINLALRKRLLPLASWGTSDIAIHASHTHNGPALVDVLHPFIAYGLTDLSAVRAYSTGLVNKIVALVQTALQARQTAVTLDYGVASAPIAFNRVGLGTVETAVPVLVARAADTWPRAIIWSYGCHPISAGWQDRWDGDWPGGTCGLLESAYPNCTALFIQGPAGDQDPAYTWSWSQRDAHSYVLAGRVRGVVDKGGRTINGPLMTSYVDASLPLETSTSPAAARAQYVTRMANPEGLPAWYQRHAEYMIARIDSGWSESAVTHPVQVWRFAGGTSLTFAMVGGELVSAYGQWARANYGGTGRILIGGYANEVSSYVPDTQFLPGGALPDGSYEGAWDPDFPTIAGGSGTVYGRMYHYSTAAPYRLLDVLRAELA
jgi:hypothetical protein